MLAGRRQFGAALCVAAAVAIPPTPPAGEQPNAWRQTAVVAARRVPARRVPAGDCPSPGASRLRPHPPPRGNPIRGRKLVERFECQRCHEGAGVAEAPPLKQCVGCHRRIVAGTFAAPPRVLAKWQRRMISLPDAPTLTAAGLRFRRDWLERYLLLPHDLRPGLKATMPRLDLTPAEARDIAAFLIPETPPAAPPPIAASEVEAGRRLFERNRCRRCHDFSGAQLDGARGGTAGLGPLLAPDLRHARARVRPERLLVWLRDPQAVKPGTVMPTFGLTEREVRQLASFVLLAPLTPPAPVRVPAPLPLLTRRVSFAEVQKRVLLDTCWHCHAEPDLAIGDGGPGNTGGLGFRGRGLNLLNYAGLAAGYIADDKQRRSVFAPEPDGTSRLVLSLRARQVEEAGGVVPGIRGMPLGLPALTPEQIQLVESWIAQGRSPR